jgi:hypothetical protein
MTDSELRIPTKELTVELAVRDGKRSTVKLRLAEHEQHLIDLLEAGQQFLPVSEPERGWSVLNKHKLLWASIALIDGRLPIEEEGMDEAMLYDRQVKVRVEFVHNDPIEGDILYSPPEGKTRITDHMNRPSHFFHLWSSDRLYVVNKHHVLRLVETEQGD